MKVSESKTLTTVFRLGKLNYSADRICRILALDRNQRIEFMDLFNDPDSELSRMYEKGVAIGEMKVDITLGKEIKKGNILAVIEQGNRTYYREINDMKKDLFGI